MKKIIGYGLFNEDKNKYGDLYIHFVIVIPPISQTILTQLSKIVPDTCNFLIPQSTVEKIDSKITNVPILYNDQK
jgi:DnaJ-class molecular chaperone